MKPIQLIQSEWGGKARAAMGPLMLYGIPAESITVTSRDQLLELCHDALRDNARAVLLFGQGFLNQLGDDLLPQIPVDGGGLSIVWIGVEPPASHPARYRAASEETVGAAVLEAVGESEKLLNDVVGAMNNALQPRFDDAVLTYAEFFCYDSASDLELHLPVTEVRDHFDRGDLRQWLEGLVQEADAEKA